MNSLQPRRIEKACGVAEDHPSVARHRRNRPPTAIRHRLRSVADHLAALEQRRDEWMLLEVLQHVLRIEPRISVVEPGYKSERYDVIFRAVNPGAAVFFRRKRPAHGVDDFSGRHAASGNFPKLFYADAVRLRVRILRQIELLNQVLGQRSARAL